MDFKKNPKTDFKDIDRLTKKEAAEEAEALREGIEYHDYLYYVKNSPEISDAVYDKLFKRLQDLEEAFPEIQTEDSPTRRVGGPPLDKLKKVKHTAPMLSLNAALEDKEATNFDRFVRRNAGNKIEYILEPKFDGLSVEIVYRNGRFQYGATRGNGEIGEDVSENLKTIRTLPLHLPSAQNAPAFLAVRGEVFMPKSGFQELNKQRVEEGEEPFSNPRNAAAGTIRLLEPDKAAGKPLDIIFYDLLQIENGAFKNHWELIQQFSEWGLKTDPNIEKVSSFEKVLGYHRRMSETRESLDYEIDGIVIKVNDFETRDKLGIRQRSPRWALALKFEPKQEITTLQEIVVQVGRTGKMTPVALLSPVDVGGVTVSRATLHNEGEVLKKDVRPGDRVRIARAGDVIPEVVERVDRPGKPGTRFKMPTKCPRCGSEVVQEGAYHFCPAKLSCPPQIAGQIIHYASRNAADIDGLGEETAKELVKLKMVKNVADLYKLSEEDFLQLSGFAEKSARNLYQAIQSSRELPLSRFLYALGIRHVGEHVAEVLARRFGTFRALRKADREDLLAIQEIGPEIAESILEFFAEQENQQILDELFKAGVQPKEVSTSAKSKPLEGKNFVFTGYLKDYTRDEAEQAVKELGGRATSSVSRNTDYLIAGENPGSKLEEAKKEGVTILNEQDFNRMLGKAES